METLTTREIERAIERETDRREILFLETEISRRREINRTQAEIFKGARHA